MTLLVTVTISKIKYFKLNCNIENPKKIFADKNRLRHKVEAFITPSHYFFLLLIWLYEECDG